METMPATTEQYEVWVEDQDGQRPRLNGQAFANREFVEGLVREYQDEEDHNARMESMGPVKREPRRFFLVRVTTNRERVTR